MRPTPRAVLLGVGLLIAMPTIWWASRPAPGPRSVATLEQPSATVVHAPMELEAAAPVEPTAIEMPAVQSPASADPAHGPVPALDRVDRLVAALREADRGPEAGFHAGTRTSVARFLQEDHALPPSEPSRSVEEIERRLDDDVTEPRVRGALLGVLRALGAEWAAAGRWIDGGEPERLALVVGSWMSDDASPEVGTLEFDPSHYLEGAPRGDLKIVEIVLRRPPREPTRSRLLARVRQVAEDMDDLLTRDLRVLSLGTLIDVDDTVLALFGEMLFDPQHAQINDSLLYVLAHAESDRARGALLEFLADSQMAAHAKARARWMLSKAPLRDGVFEILVAPFDDPDASVEDRVMAAGSMLRVLERADEGVRERVEETLAERTRAEADAFVRGTAIDVLSIGMTGGSTRMQALANVVQRDASARCRRSAAKGLGTVPGHLVSDAVGVLRAALQTETDASARKAIEESLSALGG